MSPLFFYIINNGMTTNWAFPTVIDQYSESGAENIHISWQEIDNYRSLRFNDGKRVKTTRDLLHIARDPRHNTKEKTYFLKLTEFNLNNIPTNPTGIELKINMNRFGRITDDTVQLIYNNEVIGENKADRNLDLIKIYGNDNDLWGINLNNVNLADSSFGVVIRFQSHPDWPHKCTPFIDAVELRIH